MASKDIENISRNLEEGSVSLSALADAQRSGIGNLKKDKSQCLRAVIQLRQEVSDFFDNLESEMNTALEAKHSELRSALELNERVCLESAASLRAISEDLHHSEKAKHTAQLGVLIVKAESESKKSGQLIEELQNFRSNLQFKANTTLLEMLGKIKSLGTLQTGDGNTEQSNIQSFLNVNPVVDTRQKPFEKKPLVKKAESAGSFSIRFEDDERDCDLIGSVALPDGGILYGDIGNNKLKLISSDFEQITSLKLSSFPYEISTPDLDGANVFVTLPNERRVQEIRLSRDGRKLALGRSFVTEGECRAVSRCASGLVVTVDGPEGDQIHIFNEKGKVIKRIQNDDKGNPMFRCPYNSVSLDNGREIVVSDRGTDMHSVVGLDLTTGARLFRYADELLDWPRCLAKDDRGSLYVVGGESHNVHQISEEGNKIRVLLSDADGLQWPRSITYVGDGRLLVANKWTSEVMIFYLS